MNMVKKLSVFCLVLCLTLCLAACVAGSEDTDGGSTTTTASTTTTTASNLPTYKVTVVDENGAPIAGAYPQICVGTSCIPMMMTGADGVATKEAESAEYKVSFIIVPAGYVAEDAYYFDGDAKEMVITLKAAE